jgi:hypothetical protein
MSATHHMKANVHPMVWVGVGFIGGGGVGLIVGAAICYFLVSVFSPTSRRETEFSPRIRGGVTLTARAPIAVPQPEMPEPESDVGKNFESIDRLFAYFNEKGFVMLGRFEKSQWPATIISVTDATNEISFVRKRGPRHRYPGYQGYRLKGVSLEDANGNETFVVLRSKEKLPSE